MKIWFYSDPHLDHDRDFIVEKRGFKNIQEHNEMLIQNFNSSVKEGDEVYCAGDWAWRNRLQFLNRFNGKFHFIKGNHDKGLFEEIKKSYKLLSFTEGYLDIFINKIPITICHFPMTRWEKSHYGAWHLFGHIHSNWCPVNGKIINISIDACQNKPVSFEEITEYMKNRSDNEDFIRR
jgi:calcineurin-like phosphoesterase family protein